MMYDPWLHWLKQVSATNRWLRRQRPAQRSFRPRLLVFEGRTLPSTLTVLNNADSGAGSLRAVIAKAQDGDQIVFDHSLLGATITLTSGELAISKDLDIDGPGADQLAVSGDHHSRVFDLSGGATVTIAGLTITAGLAAGGPGTGGAIENTGGHLTIANDTFSDNEAFGSSGNGRGGAIDSVSGATLSVTYSQFLYNWATGSNAASAGAINCTGSATVGDSTFIGNQSIGGDSGTSGFSRGGAIYNSAGTLNVANSTFMDNQALGGSNNTGGSTTGQAFGGAIANTDQAILFVTGSRFSRNLAQGGSNNTSTMGGVGNIGSGNGGGLFNAGVATVSDSLFEDNEARGGSGNRGNGTDPLFIGMGFGGAINTTPNNTSGGPALLSLQNVTLRHNRAVGGDGNTGATFLGTAWGGALSSLGIRNSGPPGGSITTVNHSTIANNQAIGGQGGDGQSGGDARGGGAANFFGAIVTVSGSTLTGNQAIGAASGGGGSGGQGSGGGLFNDGPSTFPTNLGTPTILTVLDSTLRRNEAQGGAAGVGGSAGLGAGGGISSAGVLTILGSRLARNTAQGANGAEASDGGNGLGGGLYVGGGTAAVLDTTIRHNEAIGGDGSNGGNGLGGGVYVGDGTVTINESAVTHNQARGGHGAAGKDGQGVGGGVYNLGTFLVDAATVIAHNHAADGSSDCFGC